MMTTKKIGFSYTLIILTTGQSTGICRVLVDIQEATINFIIHGKCNIEKCDPLALPVLFTHTKTNNFLYPMTYTPVH